MGRMTYPANTAAEDAAEDSGADWAAEAEARVLAQALKLARERGWTWAMTQAAGAAAGFSLGETELLLPNGPRDLAALYSRALDAAAMAALAGGDPGRFKTLGGT